MRNLLLILLLIVLLSCEDKKKQSIQISDDFKIEFLREILSDTTDLKILSSKTQLISNFGDKYMFSPTLPTDPKNPTKTVNHIKFISDNLKIFETVFVKQQMIENSKLDLNKLADFGFNIFDLKGLTESKLPYKSILDLADSLNIGSNNYGFVQLSVPIFNKDKTLAYIRISYGSGGETLILEKVNKQWQKKYEVDNWVE